MNDGKEPCLKGGDNFIQAFLLSVESQVSTGYGEHYPTEECSEAIFVLITQLICGVIIDGFLIGTFYAKMVKPYRKERGIKFSRNAVVRRHFFFSFDFYCNFEIFISGSL